MKKGDSMAVSATEVREFLTSVIIDEMSLDLKPADLVDDASLGPDGLDLESLAFVELTVALEHQYGLQIPDEELDDMAKLSFGAFVDDIVARLNETAA